MICRGPFLERSCNISGPKVIFEIKTCWIVAQFSQASQICLNWKFYCIIFNIIETVILNANMANIKFLVGSKSYQDFREMGPSLLLAC